MYEVYLNSNNTTLVVEHKETGESVPVNEMGFSFFLKTDNAIERQYPETYTELEELCGREKQLAPARVKAFLACNFSIKDGCPDIDEDWNFNLEQVPCPARLTGICKMQICSPKINYELTSREIEVLRQFAKGYDEQEIANALFVSKSTVHNHINNMYKKIGVVGKTSPDRKLVAYAHMKRIL